ncbi:sensor histidine kinase [Haloactinomyces albus]|uniref:histidine kinase n=1 Tax=Haloactinomyces albus TaxID=1352928 RepID=A0AAE3ZAQ0_9ACTN|nr:ATP-binding protein [Haloactinomyces albus]MDR7300166.1 signal transduction histidine kinase [Haloactinomyces albus]
MHGVSTLTTTARREPHSLETTGQLRGLLHDLGQGLGTLSLLTDGIHDDPALSAETRYRLKLMAQELSRLVDLAALPVGEPILDTVDVRELLGQLVSLTALSSRATVVLRPGADVALCTDRTLLWRMVVNLVDNAVRAAGPDGTVEIAVGDECGVVVEVIDDGPGFGDGPGGVASQGLGIVLDLARRCGAHLQVCPAEHGGTCARLVFPDAGRPPEA